MSYVDTLRAELKQTENEISNLVELKMSLNKKLQSAIEEENNILFDKWNISEGSKVVFVAKEYLGHYIYNLLKTVDVISVDLKNHYIEAIISEYDDRDYDYVCTTEKKRLVFTSLKEIEQTYNIYVITNDDFSDLCKRLLKLDITYSNFKLLNMKLAETAIRTIS